MAKWEKPNERFSGESFDCWSETLADQAEGTRRVYLRNMLKFLEWLDTDTETLYQTHWANLKDFENDPRAKDRLPKKVKAFMRAEKERGLAHSSVEQIGKSVSSFFKSQPLEFGSTKINGRKSGKAGKEKITKAQIKELIKYSGSVQTQAMICVLKDTGLRIGDMGKIQFMHIRPILENTSLQFHMFGIEQSKVTGKTGILAHPPLGPESIRALRLWIRERKNIYDGEEDHDYVFIKTKAVKGYQKVHHVTGETLDIPPTVQGDQLTQTALSPIFSRLIKKANMNGLNLSAHSFRKFFETQFQLAEIPDSIIDKYTGRKHAYKGEYVRPDYDELLKVYRENYNVLSLEIDTSTYDDKFTDFEEKIKILEQKNKNLIENFKQIMNLQNVKLTEITDDSGKVHSLNTDITNDLLTKGKIELADYVPKVQDESKDEVQELRRELEEEKKRNAEALEMLMNEIREMKNK
jgi:integrase